MLRVGQRVLHHMRGERQRREARVVYIHPQERYAVLEWDLSVRDGWGALIHRHPREAVDLAPRRRR